jgi:hypothetical protein
VIVVPFRSVATRFRSPGKSRLQDGDSRADE